MIADKQFSLLLSCAAIAFFSGCSTPQVPPERQYASPSGRADLANIVGSETPGAMILDSYTTFLIAIDYKRVVSGRKAWSVPLNLEPGKHPVTAELMHGVFVSRAYFELDAKPGHKYQVRFATDGKGLASPTYCNFWIADLETGESVTGIFRGTIHGFN